MAILAEETTAAFGSGSWVLKTAPTENVSGVPSVIAVKGRGLLMKRNIDIKATPARRGFFRPNLNPVNTGGAITNLYSRLTSQHRMRQRWR